MIPKKFSFILTAMIIFILSSVSFVQADGPSVDDGSTTGTSFGETLDFSGFNLGNIMSGKGDSQDTDAPDDGEDDIEEGDEETGDDEGDEETGDDEGDEETGDDEGDEETGDDEGDEETGDDEGDDDDDGDDTNGDDPEADGSGVKEHPVAKAIADYFGVDYEDVFELHEAGNGFGTITKAYYFTNYLSDAELPPGMTPPENPEALLDAAHGSGWGNVLKDYGIHPGSIGNGKGHRPNSEATTADSNDSTNRIPPGQAKKDQAATDEFDAGTSDLVGPGNGNGAGLGRANGQGHNGGAGNGNAANGRSNGNGNGNGRGNGGGKSNGNGKGNNK
jgi:hypothetical protein